jgi:hypothetical protein
MAEFAGCRIQHPILSKHPLSQASYPLRLRGNVFATNRMALVARSRLASQAKARSARPQKLKSELYQGVEANGEVRYLSLRPNNLVISIGYRLLQVSRTSARVLGDSPISAYFPPNYLLILMKSTIIPPAPPRLDRSFVKCH